MNEALIKENIAIAFENVKTAIQNHSDSNRKRADGGWSVGEIANHIVKGTQVNLGATKKTERAFDQHAASIRDLFLNFKMKFPAAPELLPDVRHYSEKELFYSLEVNDFDTIAK